MHRIKRSSKVLDIPDIETEVRRLRLDKWRIIYAIAETEKIIDILAVCKRPPYDYEDLLVEIEDD